MPVTIQDNSAEWFREFNRRCDKALEEIGDVVLEQGPAHTPVKTGATLNSEDKNVYPEESRVEIGAGTEYAPAIMTGANRKSGEANPFLVRMLLAAKPKIKNILTERFSDLKGYRPPAKD